MTDLKTDAKQEAALAYAITVLKRIDEMFGPLDNVQQHTDTLSWMLHEHREPPVFRRLVAPFAPYDLGPGERMVSGKVMYSADWL